MNALPNLAKVATVDLVEHVKAGTFSAAYINWARTLQLLREHAPDWMPECVPSADGSILHRAPVGGYLLIRFRHADGRTTPEVPQAVMDARNAAVPWDKITARDITDTQRRGVCMAAAFTFGLAYELWAKLPLESGYVQEDQPAPKATPTGGVWESLDEKTQAKLESIAATVIEYLECDDATGAVQHIEGCGLGADEKVGLWTRFSSKQRTALKKAHEAKVAA